MREGTRELLICTKKAVPERRARSRFRFGSGRTPNVVTRASRARPLPRWRRNQRSRIAAVPPVNKGRPGLRDLLGPAARHAHPSEHFPRVRRRAVGHPLCVAQCGALRDSIGSDIVTLSEENIIISGRTAMAGGRDRPPGNGVSRQASFPYPSRHLDELLGALGRTEISNVADHDLARIDPQRPSNPASPSSGPEGTQVDPVVSRP